MADDAIEEKQSKPIIEKLKRIEGLINNTCINPDTEKIVERSLQIAELAIAIPVDETTRTIIKDELTSVKSEFFLPNNFHRTKKKVGYVMIAVFLITGMAYMILNELGYSGFYVTAIGYSLIPIFTSMMLVDIIAMYISKSKRFKTT